MFDDDHFKLLISFTYFLHLFLLMCRFFVLPPFLFFGDGDLEAVRGVVGTGGGGKNTGACLAITLRSAFPTTREFLENAFSTGCINLPAKNAVKLLVPVRASDFKYSRYDTVARFAVHLAGDKKHSSPRALILATRADVSLSNSA
jgi:hypothetical protein